MTIEELLKNDLAAGLAEVRSQSKNRADILNDVKEYEYNDRTIRDEQVGKVQIDKIVGEGESRRLVKSIKTPVGFNHKIVITSTAFEVGKPVTLIPSIENELFVSMLDIWKKNRIDDKLQQLKTTQKIETECAIQFFIRDIPESGKAAAKNSINQVKEIRSTIYDSSKGTMYPYIDPTGDMIAFGWDFVSKDEEGKDINNTWIWDTDKVYKIDDVGDISIKSTEPHGFDRIPIVYVSQKHPEWYIVEGLIDRYEVALSKLGASNDYSGYPILKTFGDVVVLPGRNEDGKTLNFPMTYDEDAQKFVNGDAEFLTNANAVDSVKYEMEKAEELIYSISQTPNISFEKMRSIGAVSGIALELMFLDPMIKALMNEGQNRTIVERICNIIIGGITKTLKVALSSQLADLQIDVKFNSLLPKDLENLVNIVSSAVGAGVMSKKTGVETIGAVENIQEELDLIKSDAPTVTPIEPRIT